MKKTVLVLLLAGLTVRAFSQMGDLSLGLKGGYATINDGGLLYGFDAAYNLTGNFEIALTGLMNPNISAKDSYDSKSPVKNYSIYSGSLDARLYLISTRTWGIGPALGGQYLSRKNITKNIQNKETYNVLGFNIGVHGKVNITDHFQINGGWRYTNTKYDFLKYSYFYLGVAYVFQTQ